MHAAQSSSRSAGVALVQPGARELVEERQREVGDVPGVRGRAGRTARRGSGRSRAARRRTAARRGRRARGRRTRPRAGPPRSPRSRRSPPDSSTCCTTTAPASTMSPRAGLMPGTRRRSAHRHARRAGRRGRRARRARSRSPARRTPGRSSARCSAAREVAHRAADADEPLGLPRASRRARACARRARAGALSCLPLAGPSPGRKRSVIRTAPSAPGVAARRRGARARARAGASRRRRRARRRRRGPSS